jgi:hypothetical protein
MKSIVRLGLTLSLLGGAISGLSLVQPPAAFAIPEADALKRLEAIPVFTLIGAKGTPIIVSLVNPKDKAKKQNIAAFFMSQQDAQAQLTALKAQNPDIGKDAKILIMSMKAAYDIKVKNKAKADLSIEFVPPKQQIDAALATLKQNGQNVKAFPNDIPVFFATTGDGKGYLTLEQGKEKIVPFYLSKQDLQGMLDQFKKQDPKQSSATKIQVTTLSKVLDSLIKDNGAGMQQITLMPDSAAIQYALQQQGGQKAPAKAGATTPPKAGAATPPASTPAKPATEVPKTK